MNDFDDIASLTILGIRMDEMVDMNDVDEDKVKDLYTEALYVIHEDDMDLAPNSARSILDELNNPELIVFEKLLSMKKHGRKTYKTIFREYAEYV